MKPHQRVLVVDESEDFRFKILRHLKTSIRPLSAVEAGSVRLASLMLRRSRFDVVAMDPEFGGEEGAKWLEEIRQNHPRTRFIPVSWKVASKPGTATHAH
jgi:DNA-binding NtrC family response regulator